MKFFTFVRDERVQECMEVASYPRAFLKLIQRPPGEGWIFTLRIPYSRQWIEPYWFIDTDKTEEVLLRKYWACRLRLRGARNSRTWLNRVKVRTYYGACVDAYLGPA